MVRLNRLVFVVFLMLVAILPTATPAAAVDNIWTPPRGCDSGTFSTGAKWVICMPQRLGKLWNGDLVIYAHGYVSPIPARAPELPADQYALPDGTSIPDMINSLNYAFATTSYRTNGLAVKDGPADIVQLGDYFRLHHLSLFPDTFVFGVSEGGLIAAKTIEQHPLRFSGGVAACGPVGDFRKQIEYLGDFRVVFDYFDPGILTGSAIQIPPAVIADWPNLQTEIPAAVNADPAVIKVTKAAIDPADPTSPGKTATEVLWYNVFATNDAAAKLGGNPYGNTGRVYSGSSNNTALNAGVKRYRASSTALTNINKYYQTTGFLLKPLALLHNTLDPVVPYWHETLYAKKVGWSLNYKLFTTTHYAHCGFETAEIMAAFQWVVIRGGGLLFASPQDALPSPEALQRFKELTKDMQP